MNTNPSVESVPAPRRTISSTTGDMSGTSWPLQAVEARADELLERYDAWPPVDVLSIAAAEGLTIEYLRLESVAGGYYQTAEGHGRAFISANGPRTRQRFTIAHELGHHLLDRDEDPGTVWPRGETHEAHEYFAASLLMPRIAIAAIEDSCTGTRRQLVDAIAGHCGVTRIAAAVRLAELRGGNVSALYGRLNTAESEWSDGMRVLWLPTAGMP